MAKKASDNNPLNMQSLVAGLVLSAGLTVLAYNIAVSKWLVGGYAVAAVMILAAIQLAVQLVFFLHFGREKRPRMNMAAFYFMLIFLGILVVGSMWIMHNLNYNMMDMTPHEKDVYMLEESDKGF